MNARLRIQILNRCFPPEVGATGKIAKDLAYALAKRHDVTLIAGRPFSETSQRHPYYFTQKEHQGDLTTERVGSTAFHHKQMAGRLANYLTYLVFALFRVLTCRPKPDVLIAMTDPPLLCVVGALAKTVRGCRFIYDIRDLHPDMALAAGIVKPGVIASIWEWLHRWALRKADLIVVLGEDMRNRIVEKGLDINRVVVVRDGAERFESFPSTDDQAVSEIRGGFPFVVVHAGNLGFAGAWETILEAARLLRGEEIQFVFVGNGSSKARLQCLAHDLPHVSFMPFLPEEQIPSVYSAGDLYVVTIKRGLEGLVVPSKLYPILMAGRPVLAIVPSGSDAAKIVREHGCGLVANPSDAHAVAQAVLYARNHPDKVREMAQNAKVLSAEFDRQCFAELFVRIVESV